MGEDRVRLAVIGGGNMARAIVRGGLDARVLRAGEVAVCEPDAEKRGVFGAWGVRATASHAEALGGLGPDGQVLLAVKPQSLEEAAGRVRGELGSGRVVVSILAGTTAARVGAALGGGTRVVRAMPNTPARIRQGITAVALGPGATEADAALTLGVFGALGAVVRIDESLMDAFTAVAASGPAYVFYLAEAMARAAVGVGFDARTADEIVRQTVFGAAGLLRAGSEPPGELRGQVTSKGGTTAAATAVLDSAGVMGAVARAVEAARDRGRELGG